MQNNKNLLSLPTKQASLNHTYKHIQDCLKIIASNIWICENLIVFYILHSIYFIINTTQKDYVVLHNGRKSWEFACFLTSSQFPSFALLHHPIPVSFPVVSSTKAIASGLTFTQGLSNLSFLLISNI